jgi:hypothetical protein
MSGAIPPLPNTPSWHGAQLKHRDNFTFYLGWKSQRRSDNLEDLGIDGKIILEWVLGIWGGKMWAGFIWLRIRTSNWPL